MSKKGKGNGFENRAAKRFGDPFKSSLLSEDEVYRILSKDINIMLDQMTAHRTHKMGAKYPTYINDVFVNLSSAKFFYEYVMEHAERKKRGVITDLTGDQVISLKKILSDAYRNYANSRNKDQLKAIIADYTDRLDYLGRAYVQLDPVIFDMSKKLDLGDKKERAEFCVHMANDPQKSTKQIATFFDKSTLSNKKKLELLQDMCKKKPLVGIKCDKPATDEDDDKNNDNYRKRKELPKFIMLAGATLTMNKNGSDFFDMIFDHIMKQKKKRRIKYLEAYAIAYKTVMYHNKRLEGDFYKKNKKLIKKLVGSKKHLFIDGKDVGFKKAFSGLKPDKAKKRVAASQKKSDRAYREFYTD